MANAEFEFTGKDREIFLEALRNYSDDCTLPDLTPTCPFFEITPTGPSCGEQCHDLLAAHPPRRDISPALNLGFGLVAHQRRPRRSRRGPEPSSRPYDANRHFLRDRERPTDLRHTASLLIELKTQLTTPPLFAEDLEDRRYIIGATFNELVKRGFSAGDLSAALARRVAQSMLAFLVSSLVAEETHPDEMEEPPDIGDDWRAARRLLNIDTTAIVTDGRLDTRRLVEAILIARGMLARVVQWASRLSIAELAEWPAFTANSLEVKSPQPRGSAECGDWIFDRFTETYPDDWTTGSLHLEWKYLYSRTPGCAQPDQMNLRRTDPEVISREIANRAVVAGSQPESSRSVKPVEFTPIAVDYLRAGRYEAAAAIFEALVQLSPEDSVVANNLGFCLIPLDRDRALAVLERSAKIATRPDPVTYANRVLLLLLADRREEALTLANESYAYGSSNPSATLWELGEGGALLLAEGIETRQYIDSLVARMETQESTGRGGGHRP